MSGTSLGTLVTYNPWTVSPTAVLDEVAARFDELGVHHVVVVDEDKHVAGILSETDVLRARQSRRAVLAGDGAMDPDEMGPVFVRGAMTREVVTIPPSATRADALGLLLRRGFHALPVVAEGQLVGLVTSRDILREFSYGELPCSQQQVSSLIAPHMPDPLEPKTSLDRALLEMHEHGVGCLAVAQGDSPIGVLSQRDIVRAKCRVEDDVSTAAATTVIPTVLHVARRAPGVKPAQRLCEAAAVMIEQHVAAVMVVNTAGRLLGLVTEDDLLQVLYDAEV